MRKVNRFLFHIFYNFFIESVIDFLMLSYQLSIFNPFRKSLPQKHIIIYVYKGLILQTIRYNFSYCP